MKIYAYLAILALLVAFLGWSHRAAYRAGQSECISAHHKAAEEHRAREAELLKKLETEKIKRKAETNKRVNILNQATDNCLSTDVPSTYTNELYKDKRERPQTQPRVNP